MDTATPEPQVQSFFTPTNVFLLLVLAYFIYARMTKKSILPIPKKLIEPLPFADYTPQRLRKYDGVQDPHILMAINGKVYDVTAGAQFYGPRGPYKNFGGRDASRALAMGSFEDDMFVDVNGPIDPVDDLDKEQTEALNDWISHFDTKYIHAGALLENSEK